MQLLGGVSKKILHFSGAWDCSLCGVPYSSMGEPQGKKPQIDEKVVNLGLILSQFMVTESIRMRAKRAEKKEIGDNKQGLSCAKLGASLDLSGFCHTRAPSWIIS